MEKRGKVWLAVSGLVATKDGRWLFVKKKYSGLKGKWSLPAGFVNEGETVDEAVKREVLEETGIVAHVKGIIGVRSGVIRNEISDNMIIFLLEPEGENIIVQEKELSEVAFLHPDKIVDDPNTSVLIKYLLEGRSELHLEVDKTLNPGEPFGYTAYHVFTARAKEREKSEYTGTTYFNDVILYFVLWNWIFTQHDFASYLGNGYCVSDCLYAYY